MGDYKIKSLTVEKIIIKLKEFSEVTLEWKRSVFNVPRKCVYSNDHSFFLQGNTKF